VVALHVADHLSQLIRARQGRTHLLGQGPVSGVGTHRQRRLVPAQRVLDHDIVAVSGEQDADGRAIAVLGTAQEVVDGVT